MIRILVQFSNIIGLDKDFPLSECTLRKARPHPHHPFPWTSKGRFIRQPAFPNVLSGWMRMGLSRDLFKHMPNRIGAHGIMGKRR